ncbi:MAG: hypothetical protein JXQ72_01780, partial [Anaerolineae bacterium]|nr:hypothetical protein [Anaerolineae bacterium]
GWLRAALEPVGDALRFLRLDDEGKTATMPVDFVVPQALLLCNGLTESDEWRDHAGVLVDQLKDVARESVKRTHQDIQRAVDAKQIAAVRDVKPTVDGLAAVADRLPEVVGPDSELLQEIDQLLGEYGELYQLFAAWRNLARQHGVENPDRHAILEQPLGIFRKIVDLIRQSQERGWDMRDILGDDEQAIQSLVERLEQFARQIAERHEASLAQQKTYENKLDARLGEFDQTVHDFQGQLNTRATLADLGGVRRDVDNLHKIDLPSLTKRVDDIGTDLHNLPNNVASLRDLQALDMRIAEIRQQVNDLERSLKTTSPELVGLAAFREQRQRLDDAESQVIREIVGRIGGVEVKNDEARLELLQELHDIARTCSWAVFGQVFGDWDTAFQAHARTLKGYKPAKSDSADPSGFGAELSRLAEDNKGDFPIIHYWYESVCKKYQSAQPATATQSTEETQTSKHKFDQSHGSSR